MEDVLRIFPIKIQAAIQQHVQSKWSQLQEIRCRIHQPIELIFDHQVQMIQDHIIHRSQLTSILNQISAYSLYRMEGELREGYITIHGGHRIGLAGKVTVHKRQVHTLQHVTFLNIRIAKEHKGIAYSLLPYIYEGNYQQTLIVGAPKTGKTSLIRDIARFISEGWNHVPSRKVGLIDERSEIAASHQGLPTLHVGSRTDVLDQCPKAEGMMMMVRSMSPEVLIVDEIGSKEDVQAILEAMHAGVTVICTAHGNSLEDIQKRPSFIPLFSARAFSRIVSLDRAENPGTIDEVFDARWKRLNRIKPVGVEGSEMDWRSTFH